jgi:glycerate dehydrogenase
MKATFLDFATMGPGLDTAALSAILPDIEFIEVTADAEIAERIHGAEFVLGNKVRITAEHMRANPELRYIGLTATGTDNIDLDAARENDIAVCNIRAYCTQSIAEHVFGCLLNLTRSLSQFNATVRDGEWQNSKDFCLLSFPMRELSAMTLGIVGYGELGKGVATVAKAFGMEVIISARPGSETVPEGRVAFDDLLRRADVVSLHCPLSDETRDLFGHDAFAAMRPGAILINTARGGLVDSAALVSALRNGEIAAAAVDVLPEEPPVNGNPLLNYEGSNLMITPHVAWGTNEARQAALDQLAACIAAFLKGDRLNRVD